MEISKTANLLESNSRAARVLCNNKDVFTLEYVSTKKVDFVADAKCRKMCASKSQLARVLLLTG